MRKCEYCGSLIPDDSYICSGCGAKSAPPEKKPEVTEEKENEQPVFVQEVKRMGRSVSKTLSDKNVTNALILFLVTFFLGAFGIHRFIQKKTFTGILWLFTFGLFTIGYGIDCLINFVHLIREILGHRNR